MTNYSRALGWDEVKDCRRMIKRFLAEFLGSYIYMVILLSGNPTKIVSAFFHGLLLASILVFIRPMSGGHLNPAITLGALICKYITLLPAILYIIAQIGGMLLGQLVAGFVAATKSSDKSILWKDLLSVLDLEMLKTFVVVAVALSVEMYPIGGTAVGLSVVACLITALDYRAMMNPAASLAVSLFHNDFSDHWVFWVSSLAGAILAGLVTRFILRPTFDPTPPTRRRRSPVISKVVK